MGDRYINREITWLWFNGRVLQEAGDERVPLFERIKFLAIYSSNLDEFFRVRVASIRSLLRLKKKTQKKLEFDPADLLYDIYSLVHGQQKRFGEIFRGQILPMLERHGIRIITSDELNRRERLYLADWYASNRDVLPVPHRLYAGSGAPFLQNSHLYLAVRLHPKNGKLFDDQKKEHYAIIEIPSNELSRFVRLPEQNGRYDIMFLDDVMRHNLERIFPDATPAGAWSVKLTRDAELYIEDEFTGSLQKKIKKALSKRETGVPSRFLYDPDMPGELLKLLRNELELKDEDMVSGGRYHNFSDLFELPLPPRPELENEPFPPLPHPAFSADDESVFEVLQRGDVILHFPYHSYDPVCRFLREAAADPDVESISITQYRVASNSAVVNALIEAVENGKKVTVFVELKARFDEERNIFWAEELQRAGAEVHYSFPKLKVHAKICLVTRIENGNRRHYAFFSTGNFNEKTATIYTDHGLFTVDPRLADEMALVFDFLTGRNDNPVFSHLLVAPFTMVDMFIEYCDREIAAARAGRTARIFAKMNSLEDVDMIEKLYEASQAGVEVQLVVRGICCLVPDDPELSDNITAISIVDRFLEHARAYVFHNDGDELFYLASSDWMTRNLKRRVEVAFPIYDPEIRRQVRHILDLQWRDNQKARLLDSTGDNHYRIDDQPPLRAQNCAYRWVITNY